MSSMSIIICSIVELRKLVNSQDLTIFREFATFRHLLLINKAFPYLQVH